MSNIEDLELQYAAASSDEERDQIRAEIDRITAENLANTPEVDPPERTEKPIGQQPRAQLANKQMTEGPSLQELLGFSYQPVSNSVATPHQIAEIAKEWRVLGAPSDKLLYVALDLARHCADVGSSQATMLLDYCPYAPAISRQAIAGAVKAHCTLRQFCAYYAPIVWNIMLQTDKPPASWQKWEVKEQDKFTAFDFFYGVTNEAAIKPKGGLIRRPTDRELNAAATASYVNVVRADMGKSNHTTYAAEVTHGRVGASSTPRILEAP